MSLPYTHYVFSRPDAVHLGHGAPTMLLGCLALGFTFRRFGGRAAWFAIPLLLITSVLANLSQLGIAYQLLAPEKSLQAIQIGGERMLVGSSQARALASAWHVAVDCAKPDEPIFFAPHAPGLYALTGRRSPTTQIYFVFPASADSDRRLVRELEASHTQWALIQDHRLDGRDDLRFRNTNPLACDYLRKNFTVVPLATLPSDMVLLHRTPSPAS